MFGKKMKATVLAYKRFFDTEDGKLILKDLMKSCHMASSTVDSSTHETYFNEGARSVVLRILKTNNTSMDAIDKMVLRLETEEQNYE